MPNAVRKRFTPSRQIVPRARIYYIMCAVIIIRLDGRSYSLGFRLISNRGTKLLTLLNNPINFVEQSY
jgi:hypothetical protein